MLKNQTKIQFDRLRQKCKQHDAVLSNEDVKSFLLLLSQMQTEKEVKVKNAEKETKQKEKKAMTELKKTQESNQIFKLLSKLQELERRIQKVEPINALGWIDPKCRYYPQLTIYQNIISTNKTNNPDGISVFGNQSLQKYSILSFQVIKISQVGLGLGIIDKDLHKLKYIGNEKYKIRYSSNGFVWDGKTDKYKGKEFKEGDAVTITVDFEKESIEWRVGAQVLCSIKCSHFRDNKTWVPYVSMYMGSVIKILSQ